MSAVILILSDARGVYIPRDFVTGDSNEVEKSHCEKWGIKPDDAEILAAGPDHEFYWETWDSVLDEAEFTDDKGNKYRLYQDGDLWGICYDRMSMEERRNFGFDIDPPDGWQLFTIGSYFLTAIYYGDYSALDGDEITLIESFIDLNGGEIGDSVDAGFDECEITGLRGGCSYVWVKEK